MTINVPDEVASYIQQAVASGKFDSPEELLREAVNLLQRQKGLSPSNGARRQGGQWRGQVVISKDFDELPKDLAEPFGMQ
ncbi:MAG: hypothetical protein MI757_09580 [Pirellulales bacterium]|nr:hypothetical protein [Pirellulales bacterium]